MVQPERGQFYGRQNQNLLALAERTTFNLGRRLVFVITSFASAYRRFDPTFGRFMAVNFAIDQVLPEPNDLRGAGCGSRRLMFSGVGCSTDATLKPFVQGSWEAGFRVLTDTLKPVTRLRATVYDKLDNVLFNSRWWEYIVDPISLLRGSGSVSTRRNISELWRDFQLWFAARVVNNPVSYSWFILYDTYRNLLGTEHLARVMVRNALDHNVWLMPIKFASNVAFRGEVIERSKEFAKEFARLRATQRRALR